MKNVGGGSTDKKDNLTSKSKGEMLKEFPSEETFKSIGSYLFAL